MSSPFLWSVLLLALPSANAASVPGGAIEECVFTQWGFSCFVPRGPAQRLLDGPLTAALGAQVAGRALIAATALWVARETVIECVTLSRDGSPSIHAALDGGAMPPTATPATRKARKARNAALRPPKQKRGKSGSRRVALRAEFVPLSRLGIPNKA